MRSIARVMIGSINCQLLMMRFALAYMNANEGGHFSKLSDKTKQEPKLSHVRLELFSGSFDGFSHASQSNDPHRPPTYMRPVQNNNH